MKQVNVHIPYPKLIENIKLVNDKRLDLEIYFNPTTLDSTRSEDYKKLKKELNYNPRFTFHAPFIDLAPGAIDKRVREITLERFVHLFEVAKLYKPEVIVFHPGYDKWRYNGYADIWLKNSVDTWNSVLEKADKLNIKVAIENIFEEAPETLRMLVKEINSPNLGVCFDTGHFNLFSRVPLEKWFEEIGDNIIEVHLHDNTGSNDDHLGIGDGNIDFDLFFTLLKKSKSRPVLTIEGHSREAIEKSLINIQKYL